MHKLSREDRQAISLLLTPSWMSGLIAVLVGLIVCVGVITIFNYNNTDVQKQLITWQQSKPDRKLTTPDQVVEADDTPTLQGSWPLIVLWSVIGLLVYGIAVFIVHSLQSAKQITDSLGYVNAKPETVLISTAEHILIRLLALGVLIGGAYLFWYKVIPYAINAARVAALDSLSFSGAMAALLSFVSIALSLHVLTIFLRLSLARTRVFSNL